MPFVGTLDELYRTMLSNQRIIWTVLGFLAVVGIGLGAAGIYQGSRALDRFNNGFTTPMIEVGMLNVTNKANVTDASFDNIWVTLVDATTGVIDTLTTISGTITTLVSTTGTITTLESTTGTINTLSSSEGTITTLDSTTGTITNLDSTTGTITNLDSTTGTITNLETTMHTQVPKIYTASGALDAAYNVHHLNGASALAMTLPADLTPLLNKKIKICSLSSFEDTVELLGGSNTFDADGYWQALRFEAKSPCCIEFEVESATQVTVLSRACTLYCANNNFYHCVDPDRPEETNAFHGLWVRDTKTTAPSYIRIDMTRNPPVEHIYGFTPQNPLETSDSFPFYFIAENTLANDPFALSLETFAIALRLQPGEDTILAYDLTQIYNDGFSGNIYRKSDTLLPVILETTGTNNNRSPDDPVNIFTLAIDMMLHNGYGVAQTEVDVMEDFIGFPAALALRDKILASGSPIHTTNIEVVIPTKLAADGLTTFYTETYHHVPPVAKVIIAGFTGPYSALNGEHIVSAACTVNQPVPNPLFEDYGATLATQSTKHEVCIFFDSSALAVLPDGTGDFTGTPTITYSTGQITSSTNYIDTMSAIYYWMYESIRHGGHFYMHIYYNPATFTSGPMGTAQPYIEWADLKSALETDDAFIQGVWGRRSNSPGYFYTNPSGLSYFNVFDPLYNTLDSRYQLGTKVNNEFNIRPDFDIYSIRGTWWYNIARQNYLVDVKYPTYTFSGTTRTGESNLFAQFASPNGEGDIIVPVLEDFANNPQPDHSYLNAFAPMNGGPFGFPYAFFYPEDHESFKDLLHVGRINPAYTGGKNIGYFRMGHTFGVDYFYFMTDPAFAPTTGTQRDFRESAASVYAEMMRYLVTDLGCEEIIIDNRGNFGGSYDVGTAFRSLFGSIDYITNRIQFKARSDDGNGPLVDISLADYYPAGYKTFLEYSDFVFPSISAANYPDAMFTNGKVIFLTDATAVSMGDILSGMFLGPDEDRQLGNTTETVILGSIDGRHLGNMRTESLPTSSISALLRDSFNDPVSPLEFRFDGNSVLIRPSGKAFATRIPALQPDAAPSLTGLNGGNPLPEDWETTVFQDTGFRTNGRTRLTGDTRPQTPSVLSETNAFSTTISSTTVTVTTAAPHGFSTGYDIAIRNVAADVNGIPAFELEGGHVITVTGATTFTFEVDTAATSSGSGVGGSIEILARSEWRDAWLEQAIEAAVIAKKKRSESRIKAPKKKRTVEPLPSHVRQYARTHACVEGITTTLLSEATGVNYHNITYDNTIRSPQEAQAENIRVKHEATQMLMSELHNGGLCINAQGKLVMTPACEQLPLIVPKKQYAGHRGRTQ